MRFVRLCWHRPNQRYYIIESADGSKYEDINDPAWRSADGFTRQYLEDNGYIWVADSIPELAEKIGVPAEALQNSVDSYNACYDAGEDAEFGRTAFAARLEHAPFYATIRQASIHYTMFTKHKVSVPSALTNILLSITSDYIGDKQNENTHAK